MSRPEVLVFVMEGCPACHALRPLAEQYAAHYAPCIETKIIDVDSDGGLSDAMAVDSTPTVIGVNAHKQPIVRMVGHDGKPERFQRVYDAVLSTVTSCQVPPFGDV